MSTLKRIQSDSKHQFSLRWWVEQVIVMFIALVACLLGSINFI
jgi:hypothetical protein